MNGIDLVPLAVGHKIGPGPGPGADGDGAVDRLSSVPAA